MALSFAVGVCLPLGEAVTGIRADLLVYLAHLRTHAESLSLLCVEAFRSPALSLLFSTLAGFRRFAFLLVSFFLCVSVYERVWVCPCTLVFSAWLPRAYALTFPLFHCSAPFLPFSFSLLPPLSTVPHSPPPVSLACRVLYLCACVVFSDLRNGASGEGSPVRIFFFVYLGEEEETKRGGRHQRRPDVSD